jgi:hypothetical protein
MGEPLRTTPGKRMGCSQLLLHGPCGPGPTPPKTTRIQSCRRASLLPGAPIRLPHKTGYPREGTAHEWRRRHRRNPQARGNGVPLLLSPQPADRGLRRARHPSDSVPARARRRAWRTATPASSAASATAYSPLRPGPASKTPFRALPRPFPRTSRCWSFRPGCRWRGNMFGRYSALPTSTGRSPSGRRWRIRSRSCPT